MKTSVENGDIDSSGKQQFLMPYRHSQWLGECLCHTTTPASIHGSTQKSYKTSTRTFTFLAESAYIEAFWCWMPKYIYRHKKKDFFDIIFVWQQKFLYIYLSEELLQVNSFALFRRHPRYFFCDSNERLDSSDIPYRP